MKLEQGNIVDQLGKFEVVLATTNSHIKINSHLTMGKGNAKDLDLVTGKEFSLFSGLYLKKLYPELWRLPNLMTYGCVIPYLSSSNSITVKYIFNNSILGLFQTKHHFYSNSTVELIKKSAYNLASLSDVYSSIACPFPGVGFGNLLPEQVMPLIENVPNNVTFFKL